MSTTHLFGGNNTSGEENLFEDQPFQVYKLEAGAVSSQCQFGDGRIGDPGPELGLELHIAEKSGEDVVIDPGEVGCVVNFDLQIKDALKDLWSTTKTRLEV